MIVIVWIFSGWPRIWHNPPFPPEILTTRAASPETFDSTGTFTAPTGIYAVDAACWGGGGAGGGSTNTGRVGSGGGGGGYSKKTNISVTPGSDYTVSVGAAVNGGTGNGSTGNDSYFIDISTVLAKGGVGGKGGDGGGNAAGGAAASGVGDADKKFSGGTGGDGSGTDTAGGGGGEGARTTATGGNGGDAVGTTQGSAGTGGDGGDGGLGGAPGNNGNPGAQPGGGGSGSGNKGASNVSGGQGAAGRCIVSYTDTWAPSVSQTSYDNTWTFATAPNNDAGGQISMTATTGYDYNTISYSFTFTACASNGGTGGTDSGWQSADATYTDSGLDPNKCYGYTVQTKDSLENTGTASAASETYSSANVPGQPTLDGATETTLNLTNAENSNPASNPTTNFAVQVVTGDAAWLDKWVNASGEPVASEVWLTDAQLDALVLGSGGTPLTAATTYGVKVKARNENGDETSLSLEGQGETSAVSNTAPSFSGSPTDSPDPVVTGFGVIFSGTANDSESDNWKLAVCKTNFITPGASPACDADQTFCVSDSAVGTGSENTCTWASSGSTAQDWYAFACDDNASPACSSANTANSPITVNSPVYSVTITSSGIIEYGYVELGNSTTTLNHGYTQTAQNVDGNTIEKLNVRSSDATNGTGWTLDSAISSDHFKHEFSTTTGATWTIMPDSSTYVTADPSVAVSGTVDFDFRLTVPSSTSDYNEKSITITVQAVAP